nr:immunoglobulin light chain junction region [Macaca mulatta]MOX69913.1 immunoglobulin light chain junction region [Macaca mulatta]MOX70241.1 immunoglobulin light chain junction region [Macaca mulatta]MOX70352.1 immunoglobulin light chain junction region [Macaca mulatta]MOX71006.1 immunoglobulin light chain junction region [Macaca mulatta]
DYYCMTWYNNVSVF